MLAQHQNRRWTAVEIDKIVEAGVIRPEDPYELIDGELVFMPPQGPLHSTIKDRLRRRLDRAYGEIRFVKDQVPLRCDAHSVPEPDISVSRAEFLDRHPLGSETVLVVEVAFSSGQIDHEKAAIYASAGVPVYWLVNLPERRIEVHEQPGDGRYHRVTLLDDTLEVEVPELGLMWKVAELLP